MLEAKNIILNDVTFKECASRFYCNCYILITSKLRNVSSDPQFEEWVVERYGISIHCSTEFKWIFYHNRFFFVIIECKDSNNLLSKNFITN